MRCNLPSDMKRRIEAGMPIFMPDLPGKVVPLCYPWVLVPDYRGMNGTIPILVNTVTKETFDPNDILDIEQDDYGVTAREQVNWMTAKLGEEYGYLLFTPEELDLVCRFITPENFEKLNKESAGNPKAQAKMIWC